MVILHFRGLAVIIGSESVKGISQSQQVRVLVRKPWNYIIITKLIFCEGKKKHWMNFSAVRSWSMLLKVLRYHCFLPDTGLDTWSLCNGHNKYYCVICTINPIWMLWMCLKFHKFFFAVNGQWPMLCLKYFLCCIKVYVKSGILFLIDKWHEQVELCAPIHNPAFKEVTEADTDTGIGTVKKLYIMTEIYSYFSSWHWFQSFHSVLHTNAC